MKAVPKKARLFMALIFIFFVGACVFCFCRMDYMSKAWFETPTNVFIDQQDNVYIQVDYSHLFEFSRDGQYLTRWCTGICNVDIPAPPKFGLQKSRDGVGNFYSFGNVPPSVNKYDKNGKLLEQLNVTTGNPVITSIQALAVDFQGNIYVSDYNTHTISKFSNSGSFLSSWGEKGQFSNIKEITIAHSGDIFVLDSGNSNIQKFDKNGNFLLKWGAVGKRHGEFADLSSVAELSIDSQDNVYIPDRDNNRIQKFDKNGNFLLEINGGDKPMMWGFFGAIAGFLAAVTLVIFINYDLIKLLSKR